MNELKGCLFITDMPGERFFERSIYVCVESSASLKPDDDAASQRYCSTS